MSYRLDPGWEDHEVDPDYGGTRWRGHLYKALISVGVLSAFGAAVLYAYSEGAPSDDRARKASDAPLVKAQTTPVKVRPADPGGVKVPHRNQEIYRKLDIDTRKADATRKIDRQQARVPPRPQNYEDILAPKSTRKHATAQPKARPGAVRRAETKPAETRPHDTRRVAVAPTRPSARRQTADATEPKGRIAMMPSLRHRGDRPSARRDRDRQVAEVSPRAGTRTEPKARPTKRIVVQTANAIGPYRVQLGAFRTSTKAQYEWKHLSRKNKDVLGSLRMVIERVNLGPKGVYYRLQAGPLKTAPAARGLCRRLGKRKVNCILVNG